MTLISCSQITCSLLCDRRAGRRALPPSFASPYQPDSNYVQRGQNILLKERERERRGRRRRRRERYIHFLNTSPSFFLFFLFFFRSLHNYAYISSGNRNKFPIINFLAAFLERTILSTILKGWDVSLKFGVIILEEEGYHCIKHFSSIMAQQKSLISKTL